MDQDPAAGKIRELGRRLRERRHEPAPFFETRVFARIDELRAARRSRWGWRFATGALAAGLLVTWANISLIRNHDRGTEAVFAAAADSDVMIQITRASKTDRARIAYVEVQLPDGVRFVAEGIPELEGRRYAQFAWNAEGLPVFVHADQIGLKTLTVKFLDADGKLLEERQVNVRFST